MSTPHTSTVVSSFDLLGGRATQNQRRRLVFLSGIGLLVVLVLGLGGRAAANVMLTRRVDADIARLRSQQSTLEGRLTALTGTGASDATLTDDLDRAKTYVDTALADDIDQAGIIARLGALTAGRLDGVQFDYPTASVAAPTATTVPGKTSGRENRFIGAAGAEQAATGQAGLVVVVIVGQVGDQSAVNGWIEQVKRAVPELTTTNVTWKDGSASQNVFIGGPTPSHWGGKDRGTFTVTITGTIKVGNTARNDALKGALDPAGAK